MERLLVIRAEVQECEAEVLLNGVPLARLDAARARITLPVHEFTIAGPNRLEMVIGPPPALPGGVPPKQALQASGRSTARLRVLLPRVGTAADESSARCLAQLDWAPSAGAAYHTPHVVSQDVNLSVNFPRWRWLEAPLLQPDPDLVARVFGFVEGLARDLAAGEPEHYIAAARLRIEELAQAYQRRPEEDAARLHRHLLALHEAQRLNWLPLKAETFHLRPLAGGRLLECLDASGEPALRTAPDELQRDFALPLRVSVVDGKVYILR